MRFVHDRLELRMRSSSEPAAMKRPGVLEFLSDGFDRMRLNVNAVNQSRVPYLFGQKEGIESVAGRRINGDGSCL